MTEYVYLIAEEGSTAVKIGLATNMRTRLASLQTGSTRELHVMHKFEGDRTLERAMQEGFKSMRIKREWFDDPHSIIYGVFETFAEAAAWRDEILPEDIVKEAQWAVLQLTFCDTTTDEWELLPNAPREVTDYPHGPFAEKPNPDGWDPHGNGWHK